MGDFNINLLNANSHSNTSIFIDMMFESSYIPLINRPTWISETNVTLIDNMFTNSLDDNNECYSGIFPIDITDHYPICHLIYNSNLQRKGEQIIYYRPINNDNIELLKSSIQNMDWSPIYDSNNVNMAYDIFVEQFKTLYNDNIHVPPKTRNSNGQVPNNLG